MAWDWFGSSDTGASDTGIGSGGYWELGANLVGSLLADGDKKDKPKKEEDSGLSGLLPVLIQSGLGVMGQVSASHDKKRESDAATGLARDRLAFDKENAAAQLELAKAKLAQDGGGAGAAAAIAKKRLLQEAFQMLMEGGLQGSNMEVQALNNMLQAAQRPLSPR